MSKTDHKSERSTKRETPGAWFEENQKKGLEEKMPPVLPKEEDHQLRKHFLALLQICTNRKTECTVGTPMRFVHISERSKMFGSLQEQTMAVDARRIRGENCTRNRKIRENPDTTVLPVVVNVPVAGL